MFKDNIKWSTLSTLLSFSHIQELLIIKDNNEINYYQLYNINKWSIDEIKEFSTSYYNSKKNKNCLQVIYEYKLPFNQVKSLNEEELHRTGI